MTRRAEARRAGRAAGSRRWALRFEDEAPGASASRASARARADGLEYPTAPAHACRIAPGGALLAPFAVPVRGEQRIGARDGGGRADGPRPEAAKRTVRRVEAPGVLSIADGARYLRIGEHVLRRAILAGELRAARFNRLYRIRLEDLLAFFDRRLVKVRAVMEGPQ